MKYRHWSWVLLALAPLLLSLTIGETAEVTLTGGTVEELTAEDYARVDVTGGLILEEIEARHQSIVILHGFGWTPGPLIPLSGTITGTLLDGTMIDVDYERASSATIVLLSIPETDTFAMAALGLLALFWWGRKR